MPNVFDRLSPTLQLILAQCTALGLDIAALLSTENLGQRFAAIGSEFKSAGIDLKAVLAGDYASLKKPAPDIASAVEAATSALQSQLATAEQNRAVAAAKAGIFDSALLAVGITPKASDEKAGLTAADVEQAIRARASIMASEQLAKHGLAKPLDLAPAADPTKASAKQDEMSRAEFFALSPAKRLEFSKSGGRIVDPV